MPFSYSPHRSLSESMTKYLDTGRRAIDTVQSLRYTRLIMRVRGHASLRCPQRQRSWRTSRVVLSRTLPVGSRHCTLRVFKIKQYIVNFLTTPRSDFGKIVMAMLWVCAAHWYTTQEGSPRKTSRLSTPLLEDVVLDNADMARLARPNASSKAARESVNSSRGMAKACTIVSGSALPARRVGNREVEGTGTSHELRRWSGRRRGR